MSIIASVAQALVEMRQVSRPSIPQIQRVVAESFGVTMLEMNSRRRARRVTRPRQVAMYLSRKLTPLSFPSIGRHFERHHTSVIHAVQAVEDNAWYDPDFGERVASLRQRLESG